MQHRRDFLKNAFLALGGLSLPGFLPRLSAAQTGAAPMRFIFMHRCNGLFPKVCAPPTLGTAEQEKEKRNDAFEVDLDKHQLPAWMGPLEAHKKT